MTDLSLTGSKLSGNKEEQINKIATLSASMAHEFRNCLAGINICAEISEIKLKDIKERAKIISTSAEISEGKLKDIKNKVKDTDHLINKLYLKIKSIVTGEPNTENFKCYSIARNVKEAIEQYPFRIGERELIGIGDGDFEYVGDPLLTSHILCNLIKNALRAIRNSGKGKITIGVKLEAKFNKLIFKDTASGIPEGFLPKIFELFESNMITQGGTGVGLAFCKMVMKSYGGDISCRSVEGEYTEFTLKFPSIK